MSDDDPLTRALIESGAYAHLMDLLDRAERARCACSPGCKGRAEQTEHSPYMDDYCHDCTAHRCDSEGYHVAGRDG